MSTPIAAHPWRYVETAGVDSEFDALQRLIYLSFRGETHPAAGPTDGVTVETPRARVVFEASRVSVWFNQPKAPGRTERRAIKRRRRSKVRKEGAKSWNVTT